MARVKPRTFGCEAAVLTTEVSFGCGYFVTLLNVSSFQCTFVVFFLVLRSRQINVRYRGSSTSIFVYILYIALHIVRIIITFSLKCKNRKQAIMFFS